MIRHTLLHQYDLNDDAIIALLKADSLTKIDNNYFMLARANGFSLQFTGKRALIV